MLVPLQRVKASSLPAHSLCLRTILKLEVQSTNGRPLWKNFSKAL